MRIKNKSTACQDPPPPEKVAASHCDPWARLPRHLCQHILEARETRQGALWREKGVLLIIRLGPQAKLRPVPDKTRHFTPTPS